MKLNIDEAKTIFANLRALNGREVAVDAKVTVTKPDGSQVEEQKIITVPYKMTGKARWNIAKNLRVLKDHIDTFDDAVNELIKSVSKGLGEIDKDDAEGQKSFAEQLRPMVEEEREIVGLLKIPVADLKLDDNDYPPGMLTPLMPLIEGEPA